MIWMSWGTGWNCCNGELVRKRNLGIVSEGYNANSRLSIHTVIVRMMKSHMSIFDTAPPTRLRTQSTLFQTVKDHGLTSQNVHQPNFPSPPATVAHPQLAHVTSPDPPLTSLASMTVPTPTVSARVGTLLMSLSKKRALAWIVSWLRVLTRVRDTREEPGSLNATCPSGPMPAPDRRARWKRGANQRRW